MSFCFSKFKFCKLFHICWNSRNTLGFGKKMLKVYKKYEKNWQHIFLFGNKEEKTNHG